MSGVEGFEVDVRHANVTGLVVDNPTQTVTLTVVVPVSAVDITFAAGTRLVRREL